LDGLAGGAGICAMFGFKPEIAARVYVNLDAKKIAEKLK